VSFEVIPAIDVSGDRLARLDAGRVASVESFGGDPVAAAEVFIGQGARKLQVVDLDLALTGRPENLRTISLLAVMDARIQASGGVASEAHVAALAQAGAERVVLGSAALAQRELVERVVGRYGDRIVVAVEESGGRVRPRGRPDVDLPLDETLAWLAGTDVAQYLHVAVDRVGALAGPDTEGISRVAFATKRPVIASGGIASAEDVRVVASIGPFIQGAILGRALYEGTLTVREAVRAAARSDL
jgi:phosphoribosylformimino-5-aminoimidazole carboxamide ribonucleotide (ProFAR) isomerase